MKNKALIIGYGLSGKSAEKLLLRQGYDVTVFDDVSAPIDVGNIENYSLVVPSPGVPPSHPHYASAIAAEIDIAGEAQLALSLVKTPCIGVTGTNGKTTLVKRLEAAFLAQGLSAKAVGNVGEPIGEALRDQSTFDVLIVELSSYQLETLEANVFDIAFILNIEEDHLDRYDSFRDYAAAKARLQECLKSDGEIYVCAQALSQFPDLFTDRSLPLKGDPLTQVAHKFSLDPENFLEGVIAFLPPPHRLEEIACLGGITYINDSKATNVAALLYALDQIQKPIILLAGGQAKGLSWAPLQTLPSHVKRVVTFGEARQEIAESIGENIAVDQVEIFEDAVRYAQGHAISGDVILLSPGCASFDAFPNFAKRGEAFRCVVETLNNCCFSNPRGVSK